MVTLVGVAGGSGSGKTTIAQALVERVEKVAPGRVGHIAQDAYYFDMPGRDESEVRAHNFDHPNAVELSLLAEHLAELKAGRAVDVPVYDFATHTRSAEVQRIEPLPVIIVEGILLFVQPELRDVFDLRVFIDTDADIRLARRVRRDVAERGRTWDDVLRQWEETVKPMHERFVEPSRRCAHLIVPEGSNLPALELLAARVEELAPV